MQFLVQQQPAYVAIGSNGFDRTRPTTVLIHGAANNHRVWHGAIDALSLQQPAVNWLAPDLPGHGNTFADAKPSVESYADWIINLMDNGAIEKATLIGHSMGSLIALDCAKRYAARVNALALIGTSAPMSVAAKILSLARDDADAAYDTLVRASFHVQKNVDGTFPPPTPAMLAYRTLLGDSRPGILHNDMTACNEYAIDTNALATIRARTLVIIGEHDRMTPRAAAEAVATSLPNATAVVIQHAGHMVLSEASTQVLKAIGAFCVEYLPS